MANIKHGVVRTDLMTGTDVAADLRSVRYMGAGSAAADIDNGCIVMLSGLLAGEREIYKGVTPAADSAKKNLVLIATPEVMYDERKRALTDFYNEAGHACRAYVLHENDIFSVTAECLNAAAAIEVGNIVEAQADVKMKVVASATASSTKIGEVVAIENAGANTFYVIRVCD